MVIGAFPAAKLGALLLRQISKPIANVVKEQAKSSPVFRKYVCMPPAQFYNWCEVKIKMWILNLGKPVNIPVLSEAMAIELGANLLGEAIIFVVAAGVLVAEYNRSARKEAAKEDMKKQEMSELQNAIRELYIQSEEHSAQIREITRKLGYLDTHLESISKNMKSPSDPPRPKNISNRDIVLQENLIQEMSYSHDPNVHKLLNSPSLIFKALNGLKEQFWTG